MKQKYKTIGIYVCIVILVASSMPVNASNNTNYTQSANSDVDYVYVLDDNAVSKVNTTSLSTEGTFTTDETDATQIAVSGDGSRLIIAGMDTDTEAIYKVNTSDMSLIDKDTFVDGPDSVAVSENGEYYWVGDDGVIEKYHMGNMSLVNGLALNQGFVRSMEIDPETGNVWVGTNNRYIHNVNNSTLILDGERSLPDDALGIGFDENHTYLRVRNNGDYKIYKSNLSNRNTAGGADSGYIGSVAVTENYTFINSKRRPISNFDTSVDISPSPFQQNIGDDGLHYSVTSGGTFTIRYPDNLTIKNQTSLAGGDDLALPHFNARTTEETTNSGGSVTDSNSSLDLRIVKHLEYNDTTKYRVVLDNGTIHNVTANATVTSANSTLVSVNNSSYELESTNNTNISGRVPINATYTHNGSELNDSEDITISPLTIEYIDILNPLHTGIAIGKTTSIQFLIFVIVGGIGATRIIDEYAGIGSMVILMLFGWVMGYVALGPFLLSAFFGVFLLINSTNTNKINYA